MKMTLYHTAALIIEEPDIFHGRENADFGQGFYLSCERDFAGKWARDDQKSAVYVNLYELDLQDLRVLHFERDLSWFRYITRNRGGYADIHAEYDVIIGPISNDTIYDTFGILTSGLLREADALKLMQIGNTFTQAVIKTEKAAEALHFLGAQKLSAEEIEASRKKAIREQEHYQALLGRAFEELQEG